MGGLRAIRDVLVLKEAGDVSCAAKPALSLVMTLERESQPHRGNYNAVRGRRRLHWDGATRFSHVGASGAAWA